MKRKIIVLCGSTRFYKEFQQANYEETMKGNIVLSVGFYPDSLTESHGEGVGITPKQKKELDELHKDKISMADEILVLNVNQYIGASTLAEIIHARSEGKRVRYLEPANYASLDGSRRGGCIGCGYEVVSRQDGPLKHQECKTPVTPEPLRQYLEKR